MLKTSGDIKWIPDNYLLDSGPKLRHEMIARNKSEKDDHNKQVINILLSLKENYKTTKPAITAGFNMAHLYKRNCFNLPNWSSSN